MAPDPQPIATTDGRVPGRRGRATRERLLASTADLLVSVPWRSVKVIDIARQAGTSPATFYQYFENVEAAITVLAEELVEGASELAGLVEGDWSAGAGWSTSVGVVEGFMDYWERNKAVFRVVELTTVEGDLRFQGLRVRALNAVTVTLARVITAEGGPTGSPAGPDAMAVAGTLVATLAQVAAHRYGFEFWGIRTAALVDTQARMMLWAVTGRNAPVGATVAGAAPPRPRTGPVVGGGAAAAHRAAMSATASKARAARSAAAGPAGGGAPEAGAPAGARTGARRGSAVKPGKAEGEVEGSARLAKSRSARAPAGATGTGKRPAR